MSQSKASKRAAARRAEKRSDSEKIALERRLVREGKIYPRAHYMPRGHFRGIVAVALAFLLGIFFALGGLIGAGIWLGSKKSVGDILELLGISQEKYSEYIYDEYAELSILDLVNELSTNEFKSLSDVAKYSPAIDKEVASLLEEFKKYGADVNREKLMRTAFADLGTFFMDDVLHSLRLGQTLQLDGSASDLLLALCFGEEGIDYEIGADGSIVILKEESITTVGMLMENDGIDDLMSRIRLGTLLGIHKNVSEKQIKENATMYAISYGKYGVDYVIDANGNIKVLNEEAATSMSALMNESGKLLDKLELGAILGIDFGLTEQDLENNAPMYALCYGSRGTDYELEGGKIVMLKEHDASRPVKVGDLTGDTSSLFDGIEISSLIGATDSRIMQALAERGITVGDLKQQSTLESLRLDEILEIGEGSSALMRTIGSWKISDLTNEHRFDRIKLGQLLGINEGSSAIMQAMKDWRIGDLTSQGKIDSLTLGDVIVLDESSPAILKALADTQIGQFQTRVNTLRIRDMLSEEDLENNKLLRHLKDSTVTSLANDIKALTVSDVFGDEIFSYMKIETKTIELYDPLTQTTASQSVRVDYNWLYNTYFHNTGKTDPRTVDNTTLEVELYNYHYEQYNDVEKFSFRPTAMKDVTCSNVTTKHFVIGSQTEVVAGYYLAGKMPVPSDVAVIYDSANASYYFEREIRLTPHHVYNVYDYDAGTVGTELAFEQIGDEIYLTYEGASYLLQEDSFSYYILLANGDRVDVERTVSHYTMQDGTALDQSADVRHAKAAFNAAAYDYIIEKVDVEKLYQAADGRTYTEGETEERYFYEGDEVDRYLSDIWFFLLTDTLSEGDENYDRNDPANNIVYHTDAPILNIDTLITTASTKMQYAKLAELWFHGILDDNPFLDLSESVPTGIRFTHGDNTRIVKNLIEISMSETFALVKSLTAEINKLLH